MRTEQIAEIVTKIRVGLHDLNDLFEQLAEAEVKYEISLCEETIVRFFPNCEVNVGRPVRRPFGVLNVWRQMKEEF